MNNHPASMAITAMQSAYCAVTMVLILNLIPDFSDISPSTTGQRIQMTGGWPLFSEIAPRAMPGGKSGDRMSRWYSALTLDLENTLTLIFLAG
jgi:hypothetical protein